MSTEPAPITPVESAEGLPAESPAPIRRATPTRLTGVLAAGVAVLAVVAEVTAIAVGTAGAWPQATLLAWAVITLTAIAVILGVVAVVRRRGRGWGVAAILLGVAANPLVQIAVLGLLGGH